MALNNSYVLATNRIPEVFSRIRDGQAPDQVTGQLLITDNPKESDREAVEGKFKSYHNASDNSAKNMTSTFFALLKIADISHGNHAKSETTSVQPEDMSPITYPTPVKVGNGATPTFHYNIQVHLPASKDPEVYNAIFKSMRDHFVDR